MECPQNGEITELVVGYVARTLESDTEAAFCRHLEACAACREMVVAQQAVWTALDEWAPAPVSPDFDETLHQRIASARKPAWWERLLPANWPGRVTVPAALACATLVAAFLFKNPGPAVRTQQSEEPRFQIEQVERALDDMDMLKQVGVEVAAEMNSAPEKI
jgi:anti-sigma factor RsiW